MSRQGHKIIGCCSGDAIAPVPRRLEPQVSRAGFGARESVHQVSPRRCARGSRRLVDRKRSVVTNGPCQLCFRERDRRVELAASPVRDVVIRLPLRVNESDLPPFGLAMGNPGYGDELFACLHGLMRGDEEVEFASYRVWSI